MYVLLEMGKWRPREVSEKLLLQVTHRVNGKIRIRFQVNLIPELTLNAQNCLYCPVKGAVEKVVEERLQG